MATIKKFNLEAKASGKLISLATAKASTEPVIKVSASTEFIANIAQQLGMTECISVYEGRAYVADTTVLAINELLG